MSEEIKLGWYRSTMADGHNTDIEVVAVRGDKAGCYDAFGGFFTVHVAVIRNRKYHGTEQPKKGRWVDFDPAKVTCDQFPIAGRVSDNVMGWIDAVVSGYNHTNSHRFIVVNNHHNFKNFQVWEADE